MRTARDPHPATTVRQANPASRETSAHERHKQTAVPTAPLRTPFAVADELSCYYDAPAEPCNVHVEVRIPGHLDGPTLRRAVGAALAAQPRALLRRAPGGWWRQYAWEAPGQLDCDPVTTVTWADEAGLARERAWFLAAAPPLRSSPPVRVLLAAGPDEDRVILNAHHAALDGLSCLELLRSIAGHYPGGVGLAPAADPGSADLAPAADPGSADLAPAADPGSAGLAPMAVPAVAVTFAPPLSGPGQTARARPGLRPARPTRAARIAADRAPGRARPDRSGYGFRLLPGRPVPAARRAGPGPHATVNDLLIAALIAAIGHWNTAHGRPPGRIRITMPVNARPRGQGAATGNLSRLTAVTAPAPADGAGDLSALVTDVAAQTRAAKEHAGPQVDPLSLALAAAWCPPAVKRRLIRLALRTAGPLLCDTSLVSNLGVVASPPRFGSATADGLWFSTSAHMPRGLSVGAVTVGGRLHLCLRYRRALFSEPSAARFADAYVAALADVTSLGGTDSEGADRDR